MRDPIPAPTLLVNITQPLAERLSLTTLPNHVHEIIIGFLFYHFVLYFLSPTLSRLLCPKTYRSFNARTRLNWDIHWVSMVQALFINTAALYVIFTDNERKSTDWKARLWGYSPASGMVQGFAGGYFLWDLQVSVQYYALSGLSALLHAMGALAITMIGFRPFGNYYGLSFVLYELSTPFLNIHWFCDKLNLTGSKTQLYNGIALIASFFFCRVLWGTYQSVMIYSDIYTALTSPSFTMDALSDSGKCDTNASGIDGALGCEARGLSGELPMWLVGIYLVGNTVLSLLNLYWFSLMVKAVRKRFVPKGDVDMKKGQ